MWVIKMAVRNLFRNTRRSLLTIITIFVGVLGFIASSALVRGIEQSFIRIEIATDIGHLRIFRKGYLKEEENFPLDIVVKEPQKIEQALKNKFPTAVITKRIMFSAQLSDTRRNLHVRALAVDPETAETSFQFSKYASPQQKLPLSGNVIYMGVNLAESFQKKSGDTITVLARTQAGSINAIDFKILATLSMGNFLVDANTIYMPLQTGRSLLAMKTDITDMVVFLPSKHLSEPAAAVVANVAKQDFGQTWQDKTSVIIELNSVRRKMLGFLIVIILLVAAVGTANTILMSGFERRGEIGMMMAMGLQESRIIRMFTIEASILGVVGSVLGTLVGSALSLYYQIHGLDLSKQMSSIGGSTNGSSSMSMASIIFFELTPTMVIQGLILGTIVATIAALWPAYKITRFEPREVLAGN